MKNFILFFSLIFLHIFSAAAQQTNTVLAKFGTKTITVADLDMQAQEALQGLPEQIAAARRRMLELAVAEELFALESESRRITVERLLDIEVKSKLKSPSDTEIQSIYDQNRAVFGDIVLDKARFQIVAYLQNQQREKLLADFANSLQNKYKITAGVDPNALDLKPNDVLAVVGTKTVTADKILNQAKAQEYAARRAAYELAKNTLEETLYSQLVLAEAQKINLTPEEYVGREINAKIVAPTDADAQNFYAEHKKDLNNAAFETVKTDILTFLINERRAVLKKNLRERLSKQYGVQILLKEPVAPVLQIKTDGSPSKGPQNAPVTIVMFSDFQCSHCAATHPILTNAIAAFPAKVRFVVRNFPLEQIHERAFRAAQAAQAANAQGRFFEYIELLYQNQAALDDASLKKYAAQIGLNIKQFETDLSSGRFDALIRADQRDGQAYGITGTPTVYINGKIVTDYTVEGFKNAIQNALLKK
jgi:protein-disulfide isomerase